MTFKDFWMREVHVAMHAQTARFRVVKWVIILLASATLYFWKGIGILGHALLVAFVVSIFIHFLFRYMSDGWTKSWGPYKHIKLDGEKTD